MGETPTRGRSRLGQPAGRRRVLAVDAVLARQVGGQAARAERLAAALVGRIGLPPALDRGLALPQPPERLAQPVERLGIPGLLGERLGERVAGERPVGPGEVLPAGFGAAHTTALSPGAPDGAR